MKKLAYGMLFGMGLLVGCEPAKVDKKPADAAPAEKAAEATKPGDEMAAPADKAVEAPADAKGVDASAEPAAKDEK